MKLFLILTLAVVTMAESLDIQKILHNGNNQFTARMFSEVVKENKNKNVVLSAFSVITPLAQLAMASEGASHDELLNAIGFSDDDTTTAVLSLIHIKLSSIEGVELKKASKLYIPLGFQVQAVFATLSKYVYNSEIANVNFVDNENTAKEINAWVEDQTNHRIKDLVSASSLSEETRGVLVNALYFKGSWKHRFHSSETRSKSFFINKKETIQVPYMHNSEVYGYGESEKLKSKILELPYVGDQTSFVMVLPHDVEGIGDLVENLKDPNILDEETKKMINVEVQISIPKFKIETTTDLKEILQKMNVTKIFGNEANLTKLLVTDEKMFITDAVQKAFIEINEDGAEAAAANSFGIAIATSLITGPNFQFIADHPFAFFLMEGDEILFNGIFYGS